MNSVEQDSHLATELITGFQFTIHAVKNLYGVTLTLNVTHCKPVVTVHIQDLNKTRGWTWNLCTGIKVKDDS